MVTMNHFRRKDVVIVLVMVLAILVQAKLSVPHEVFKYLNALCAHWPVVTWQYLTLLGDTMVLLCLLAPLLLYRPQWVYGLIGAIPLGGFFSVFFKNMFNAPRPGDVLPLHEFHTILPTLSGHSFPSGHSITAFAFAGVIWASLRDEPNEIYKRSVQTVSLGIATVIAYSRIALGVHWPLDVLAGACMGWLSGISGDLLVRRYAVFWNRPLAMLLALLVLMAFANYLRVNTSSTHEGWYLVMASIASVSVTCIFFLARTLFKIASPHQ
jgi:membrane-associated phospholipid phosphatase